jgi:hypothetical protein
LKRSRDIGEEIALCFRSPSAWSPRANRSETLL